MLDDDPIKRASGHRALLYMRQWDLTESAKSLIQPSLMSKNPLIVERARKAVEVIELGPWSSAERDILVADLRSTDANCRWLAAFQLQRMGAAAAPGIPWLIKLLHDPDDATRRQAALTIANCGPRGKPAVPVLLQMLKDKANPIDQVLATIAIGRIGPDATEGVPLLIRLLQSDSNLARAHAAWALSRIGPKAAKALKPLQAAIRDTDAHVRTSAAIALWYIAKDTEDSLPVLIATITSQSVRNLNESDAHFLRVALRALADMGPAAKPALPELLKLQKYDQYGLNWWATIALNKIRARDL